MVRTPRKSARNRYWLISLEVLLVATLVVALGLFGLYRYLEPQLPDIAVLKDVRYQIPMSVYSRDGKLIAQFGEKKRSPVAIEDVPPDLAHAFIAAEDDRFYDHVGVDYQGILRALLTFARTGEKRQGGSTITMQVARNFFLSSEKTFLRKVKEIMLAIRIDSELPKDQILELYLNKIYFGQHAYGIEAAALVYYGKHVGELTLGEMAMIAGLPKAPSAFNPVANPERAQIRRNYVLRRMRKLRFITDEAYQKALNEAITASIHIRPIELDAPYIAEMVRAEMYQQYGEDAYESGYAVHTTIDSHAQLTAESALQAGLRDYDERHGYRKPKIHIDLKQIKSKPGWNQVLEAVEPAGDTVTALVLTATDTAAGLYTTNHGELELTYEAVRWAKSFISQEAHGGPPRSVKEVLKPGDVVRVRKNNEGRWVLTQVPKVQGALVELDADNGAIIAVAGGFDYRLSKFNRATQGQRQPGSGFKPVVYSAALDSGFTPASVVNDSPISFADPASPGGVWRPHNYSMKFAGPTPLREALAKSRNMVSIRLLRAVGLPKVIELAERFGFTADELPRSFTLALGSGTASPLRMAQVYAVFANGGYHVDPFLISRIETQSGRLLYQATPPVACMGCSDARSAVNQAKRVISEEVHYMMNSMLQDVVRRGTATKALELGRSDLAGKTGTTNEYRDAWFNGYVPGIVAVSWVGFDSYQPLGDKETGGQTALPIWIEFMKEMLRDVPERKFPQPVGIMNARVDPATGNRLPASIAGGTVELVPRPAPQPDFGAPAEEPGLSSPQEPVETYARPAPESEPPEEEEASETSAPPRISQPAETSKPIESLF